MADNNIIPDINVGEALRRWLKVHNITRQQFADAMGMYTSKVGRILSSPTIDTEELLQISKVLQVNFFEMFWSDTVIDEFGNTLQSVHIGQAIDKSLKNSDITQAKLAELIGVHQTDITRLIKKQSIDSGKLTAISRVLNHNFFLDFYGNIEETATDLAIKAGYYMGKYNKLLVDYERINRQLSDSQTEAEQLKKEVTKLRSEINELREENAMLKSNS
jgi:transcriptional regulator with XRE-family HTH domain